MLLHVAIGSGAESVQFLAALNRFPKPVWWEAGAGAERALIFSSTVVGLHNELGNKRDMVTTVSGPWPPFD
jgi:hypothetical protein